MVYFIFIHFDCSQGRQWSLTKIAEAPVCYAVFTEVQRLEILKLYFEEAFGLLVSNVTPLEGQTL